MQLTDKIGKFKNVELRFTATGTLIVLVSMVAENAQLALCLDLRGLTNPAGSCQVGHGSIRRELLFRSLRQIHARTYIGDVEVSGDDTQTFVRVFPKTRGGGGDLTREDQAWIKGALEGRHDIAICDRQGERFGILITVPKPHRR